MEASSTTHSGHQCSDIESANSTNEEVARSTRHLFITDTSESYKSVGLNEHPATTAIISKSGDDVPVNDEIDGDLCVYRAVSGSSQGSIDADGLAEKYSNFESADSEQLNYDGSNETEKRHLRHAIKISRKYLETKRAKMTLQAEFDSHWAFSVALNNKAADLESEIKKLNEKLESCSVPDSETETKRHIRSLEKELKQKNTSMQMLKYGAQSKCGVCYKTCKISESHPYSREVLETAFGADYSGIFDLQQKERLHPSDCSWMHLCAECNEATREVEEKFNVSLESALNDPKSVSSDQPLIFSHYTDLFHVYTFRALLRNVDTYHYIPGCEEKQECTCIELLHPLNNFLKRAHHLSKPIIWKDRPIDQETKLTPSEAGMLYHVRDTEVPPEHWIEFPLICKVNFESGQKSHHIIYAQIPPFYWAFPLPLHTEQDVPDNFSEDMRTSDVLVERHYREAMDITDQLSRYFERGIIVEINKELERRRESLDKCLQKWRDDLEKDKQKIEDEGKIIEEMEQKCADTEENLSKEMEKIMKESIEIEARLMKKREEIKSLKAEEKKTNITKCKQETVHKIRNSIAKERSFLEKSQELSKKQAEYNALLSKNASEQDKLYEAKDDLYKRGLGADIKPKMLIGYFRTESRCCLEVTIPM